MVFLPGPEFVEILDPDPDPYFERPESRSKIIATKSKLSTNTSEIWKGTIGPTKIYNRALTAAEILQNYNAHKDRFD